MKHVLVLVSLILITPISAIGQGEEKPATQPRMVSVGDHRIAVYCDGEAGRTPTVILIAGGGRTAADWAKVQPGVASFARVCSYDPVNLGASDKTNKLPWAEELVDDLHAWLKASGEKGPFILVAHSISGIHARRFVTKYPGETAGLVFVDSSHEEQALRIHEFAPNVPGPDETTRARMGWYVKPGQRLDWKTELPLVVLARGKPLPGGDNSPFTAEQRAALERIWRGLQGDLAKRSTRGELRVAEQSGHLIQLDQPEMVIQAIRDVSK